jgi:hypothetical protein
LWAFVSTYSQVNLEAGATCGAFAELAAGQAVVSFQFSVFRITTWRALHFLTEGVEHPKDLVEFGEEVPSEPPPESEQLFLTPEN